SFTYEATVSWIEQITENGFTACIETAGPVPITRTVKLNWMAYAGSPKGGLAGSFTVPLFTTGTECVDIDILGKSFASAPYVYVTAVHTSSFKNNHDALSVWAEGATKYSFKACMREMKSFDGVHDKIKIDWLVLEGVPNGWSIPFGKAHTMTNIAKLDVSTRYSFCEDISFSKNFYAPPIMITTALHNYDKSRPNSIRPDFNAYTEWMESVTNTGFKVCMKDIQPFEGHHDPIDIEYLAIGDLDPCIGVKCDFYAYCKAFGPKDARCVCPETCPSYQDQKCGDDKVTYKNICELQKAICNKRKYIGVVHDGPCFTFILHRGRVLLHLDAAVVQCKTVNFSSPNFLPNRKVHIQASVNYNHASPNATYIHDAAVAWTEKITTSNFIVCALKTGRNDRATPDNGRTFVDYIAYQGAPLGAVAGEEVINKWWDGTTCKKVSLPEGKFAGKPNIIAAAQHGVLGQKHDAATTWVEDVTNTTFRVCLRELQNFDGLHQNVKVNWMAYVTLPAKLSTERHLISFPNDYLPPANDNNAFCKNIAFSKTYTAAPTVIVTPGHSTGVGNIMPDYNSIAAWVEHIGKKSARICIKELHSPNGYDPVQLTCLIIGKYYMLPQSFAS
ncbi:hypothetical protein QZH41_017827, partial [Actinostola sp. cb2023]